jgi:acyl-CoA hydrolase
MNSNFEKTISPSKAVGLLKSNDMLVVAMGGSEPQALMSHLHEAALGGVTNLSLNNCLSLLSPEYITNPEYRAHIEVSTIFFGAGQKANQDKGNIFYLPSHLHLGGYKRFQHMKPNVFMGSCTPPDSHGYVSLSLANCYEKRALMSADTVILEINPLLPRTFGDVEVHIRDVDYFVESSLCPPTIPDAEPDELDMKIGQIIADEIEDGDCIQLGIGAMPNAIAKSLYCKKDLGVHTEMLTSEICNLAEKGVITGKKKRLHTGKMICTFILGTNNLYDFVSDNPAVGVFDAFYVNDPYVIGQNDNQVSINSAVEVDLTGQCASETIGTRHISGTGGQADTAIGAQISKGGRSYICLHSTAMVRGENGEKKRVSKIVPNLNFGAVVSLSRNDVDRVVTEYGVAYLRGTNVRERAERLIAIAHPDFREELQAKAYELKIIQKKYF